jgi:ankyrin repeat protein
VSPAEPFAAAAEAVRAGDLAALETLLRAHPGLPRAREGGDAGRTLLHVATDWPGFFPRGPAVVRLLLGAGADPNARTEGASGETPLHWAASSDDAEVARALLDGGADPDAPGGSIGTPLANAVGYGCWQVAQLLVDRGARVETLWEAAALGLTEVLEAFLAREPGPTPEELHHAFWQACHGGQPRAAALLLTRGADPMWIPAYASEPAPAIARAVATRRQTLQDWLRARGLDPAGARP